MEAREEPRSILSPTTRIGEILVRAKLITPEQLATALQRQRDRATGRLGEHLIALGYISESDLIQQLAKQFGIPVVDPSQIDIPPEVLGLLPPALVRKNLMLPLTLAGSTLTVTMADPSNYVVINEAKFL
ncbi:MAG: hypothetical protein ACREQ9_00625, partial [Candidatus Binatia bacterium]